jgi:biotin carboxyl carrier protein
MRLLVSLVILAGCATPPPAAPAPVAATPPPAAAPAPVKANASLDGYWTGVLGGQLHLALQVTGDTAILDSIDQGAKLPIDKWVFDGSALHFEIAAVHGAFDGKLAGDTIAGTWSQGHAQPLEFKRGTPPPAGSEPAAHPPAPLDAPIDVTVPKLPTVFHADGRTHLVYELHIDNFAMLPIALQRIDVMAGVRSLATFDHAALADMTADKHVEIRGGGHAVVFMWVSFDGPPPAKIDHVIVTKLGDHELTTNTPTLAIAATQPRVVSPPLKGANWLAANGPANTSSHRRALIPVGGHARIAQRFAIDWVQVGDDHNTFTGDASNNASYHAYGQQALAIAAGTVVEVRDGIIENVPQKPPAVPITLDTVAGNHVVLDLGGGVFAMYAHFQPGSIKVKVGDKVKVGQVLALVGNSGNSTEPHLHFQITDAGNPLGSEGIPYAFPKFSAHKLGEPPQARTNSLPTENELVDF